MATLLLCVEANEGLGHVTVWQALVRAAAGQGAQVHVAVPSPGLAHLHLRGKGIKVWQAPRLPWPCTAGAWSTPAKNWPELLCKLGYAEQTHLSGACQAWRQVMEHVRPSMVLADYAPAALLAARSLGISAVEAGGGFCVPPLGPQLAYFPGAVRDPVAYHAADQRLCAAFSGVLHELGLEGGTDLMACLGSAQHRVVLSPPELDHYGYRADVKHLGFLAQPDLVQGMDIVEQRPAADAGAPAIIGYLKPTTPGLAQVLACLDSMPHASAIHVPGDCPEFKRTGSKLTVFRNPLEFEKMQAQASVLLSNGGLGGVGLALRFGLRPVLVPQHAEQVAMAHRLHGLQWGDVWLPGRQTRYSEPPAAIRDLPAKNVRVRQIQSAEDQLLKLLGMETHVRTA